MTIKIDQKSVQVLTDIPSNILRVCFLNHCVRAIKTKITRAFLSNNSRTRPISSHDQELSASKHISVADTGKLEHEIDSSLAA
jgi:hypothetical protein